MNVRLHKKDGKTIMVLPDDKGEFEFKERIDLRRRLIVG
jgi:hypothetical protein